MSGLTEKLQDAVLLLRSKDRPSKSLGEFSNGSSSDEYGNRKSAEVSDRDTFLSSNRPTTSTSMGGTVQYFHAMNINDSDKTPTENKTVPPLPPNATQRIQEAASDPVNEPAYPSTQSPVVDAIPSRKTSMPRKPVGVHRSSKSTSQENSAPQKQGEFTGPIRLVGHKTNKSIDLAPSDPSTLVPRKSPPPNRTASPPEAPHFSSREQSVASNSVHTSTHNDPASPTRTTNITTIQRDAPSPARPPNSSSSNSSPITLPPRSSSRKVQLPEHVHPPSSMKLRNATETLVDTSFSPSITREAIHHQTHEVITPVISHDIHIDHYYHYLQPVRVLEILPARHFQIDPASGKKIEIPTPEGWVAPAHMRPTAPGELDGLEKLEATERHYVVDETNPRGRIELPPAAQQQQTESRREG